MGEASQAACIAWGVANRTAQGQEQCGDAWVAHAWSGGAMVAALDGLGHGPAAAEAAQFAADLVASQPHTSVISLARQCHEALTRTRGVVMNIARFSISDDTMTWLAIGNVEGVLVRADPGAVPRRESILGRAGVVGLRLPILRADVTSVAPGDLLVFATDGVRRHFTERVTADQPLQHLADTIVSQYARDDDDALALVVRYLGRDGHA